jgi:hypothetical protein
MLGIGASTNVIMPNLVTSFKHTPKFEWYVDKCLCKNECQNYTC